MLLSGGDHAEDTPMEGIGAEPEQSCQPEQEPEEMQDASERLPLLPIQSQELSQVSDPPVCMRHTWTRIITPPDRLMYARDELLGSEGYEADWAN